MIKTFIFTFLLSFACSIGFTQTREAIDSLQHQLVIAKDDTSRINAQTGLCYLYRLGNADSSILYGQQALQLSQQINYPVGEVWALALMSIIMEQMGNLPKALEMAFHDLQLAKTKKLEYLTGPASNAIGETYIILKDYPKALSYLRTEKLLSEANNSEESLAYALLDMGSAFEEMNQLDSAYFYEESAITTFQKYKREEPLVYITLGDIEIKSGKPAEALSYYKKSLQISVKNNERRASAIAYNKIAEFYKNVNQPDSAIYYAVEGLEESRSISKKKTIMEAAALLSELYEPKDTKESLRYLKIADAYKDSLFGAGNIQAVQTLVAHEEERQKEIEASRVAYQNQLKQYALIAGLAILLLIAFFLYRNNRKEKKAKNLLKDKNEVIEQTLNHLKSTQSQLIQSEKMASLGELTAGIAHEIQNPLNFVNNFSEVNTELIDEFQTERNKTSRDFKNEDDILNDIKENEKKINMHGKRADFIVKGMLQHSRSGSGERQPTNINTLAEEFFKLSYQGLRAKDKAFNAEMITHLDVTLPKPNVVQQDIGRVLLNLFNNAFYAVNQKAKTVGADYKPEVILTTLRENGNLLIKVKDNGVGIPDAIKKKILQPFFTTKPTGEGTGLGLSLSYDILVKGHNGTLDINSVEGEGSEFIVRLPAG